MQYGKILFLVLPKARDAFGLYVKYAMLNISEKMAWNQFAKEESTRFNRLTKKGKFPAELIPKTQYSSKVFCSGSRGVLRPIGVWVQVYKYTNLLLPDQHLLATPLLTGCHTDITSKELMAKFFLSLRQTWYYFSQMQCKSDREHSLTFSCIFGFRHWSLEIH